MLSGLRLRVLLTGVIALILVACGDGAATVRFVEPTDGATVSSPVQVVMESEDITIEPAGEVQEGSGHFHILIDVGCVEPGTIIPGPDDQHLHFGDGSTETVLDLEPGEYSLCLQVGDGIHTALEGTDEITITVE